MVARTQLAALDHNHNTGRNQATTATGKDKKRYKLVFPKAKKQWVAKTIYESKSYSYLDEMMTKVIGAREKKPNIQTKHKAQTTSCSIASNTAHCERPAKREVVENYKQRCYLYVNIKFILASEDHPHAL